MVKWLCGPFLLLLIFSRLSAQEDIIDSRVLVRKCNNKATADTTRVQLLVQLSELYLPNPAEIKRIRDSALSMAVEAKQLSHRFSYERGEANADFQIGKNYIAAADKAKFIHWLTQVNDTTRIKLMAEFIDQQLQASSHTRAEADTMEGYALKAVAASEKLGVVKWRVRSWLSLAGCLAVKGDKAKTVALLKQSFDLSRQHQFFEGEVQVYATTAICRGYDPPLIKDLNFYREQMIADYQQLHNATEKSAAQHLVEEGMMSAMYTLWNQNEAGLTEKELVRAISFGKNLPEPDITPHYSLVFLYLYNGALDKALSCALDAVKAIEKNGNKALEERPYVNLGKVYSDMHKWEVSLEYYNKAVALIKQKGHLVNGSLLRMITESDIALHKPEHALPLLLSFLDNVVIYSRMDRLFALESVGQCYFALHDYRKAEAYLLDEVKLAEQSASVTDRYNAYEILANVYVAEKRYDKARYYYQQILRGASEALAISSRQAHRGLYKIDSATGSYRSALQHYQAAKTIDDSIFKSSKSKQFEELQLQYETEKKDRNIEVLTKQGQLQAAHEQKQRLLRNGLAAGSCMLVLLLGVGFSRYRIKQKSNRLLQAQYARQQQLTEEKEWLVKEVHHRVKNNLQMVLSLLNMQRFNLKDALTVNAFETISARIHAISLIHHQLYQVHDLVQVNMQQYISELIRYLDESGMSLQKIRYNLEVDNVELDAAQGVPIGLILNEAVTNSMKYAFRDITQGVICVALKQLEDNRLMLVIQDNGIGLPEKPDKAAGESLGLELIEMLSEQLNGELTIQSNGGVCIRLVFVRQSSTAHALLAGSF